MTKEVDNIKKEMIEEIDKIILNNNGLSHTTETMDFTYQLKLLSDGSFTVDISKNNHGNPVFLREKDDNILKNKNWHDFSLNLLAEILENHQDE